MSSKGDALGRGALGTTPEPQFVPLSGANTNKEAARLSHGSSLVYITRDDRLMVFQRSQFSTNNVNLRVRILRDDGQVTVLDTLLAFIQTLNGQNFFVDLCEGYLLDLTLGYAAGQAPRGTSFAQAFLVRGTTASPVITRCLFSDYVGSLANYGYPIFPGRQQTDGQGLIRSEQVANPAAGAEWVYTVQNFLRKKLLSVAFTFVTAAGGAARTVQLVVDDGANIVGQFPANVSQAASLTNIYTGASGLFSSTALATTKLIPLPPDVRMVNGWRVRSLTDTIQAADQYSNIWLMFDSWLDG